MKLQIPSIMHELSPIFSLQDGDTALHIAVRSGLLDSVEALLQCSADLGIRNKVSKQTAYVDIKSNIQKFVHCEIIGFYHKQKWGFCMVHLSSNLLSPTMSVQCIILKRKLASCKFISLWIYVENFTGM